METAKDHLVTTAAPTRSNAGATLGAHRVAPTAPEAVAAEEVDHPEAEVEGHLAEEALTATALAPRTEMPVQWCNNKPTKRWINPLIRRTPWTTCPGTMAK